MPSGLPTQAELFEVYDAAMGVPTTDMDWFDALTRYKEAAAMALSAKHARARSQRGGSAMGGGVVNELIADAHRRVR